MAKRKRNTTNKKRTGRKPRVEDILAKELHKSIGVMPVREYKFHPVRLWLFDLAYPDQLFAIEIQGYRSHSRPTAIKRDCEKFNAAVEFGWTVLKFPADAITTKTRLPLVVDQIKRVLFGAQCAESSGHVLTGQCTTR